jgi:hypothetical protein
MGLSAPVWDFWGLAIFAVKKEEAASGIVPGVAASSELIFLLYQVEWN